MAQGVPLTHVERFLSHDGRRYTDFREAQAAALKAFHRHRRKRYGTPDYLHGDAETFDYCWHWTWFDTIQKIAVGDNNAVLVLIDDWMMKIHSNEICGHLQSLRNLDPEFQMLQYVHNETPLGPLAECSNLQRGSPSTGDPATVFTIRGAQHILDFMSQRPMLRPAEVVFQFARNNPHCYSSVKRRAFDIAQCVNREGQNPYFSIVQDRLEGKTQNHETPS